MKRKVKINAKKLNKQFIREVDIRGEKVKIYTVNGDYIRHYPKKKPLHPDFTMGTHKRAPNNTFTPDGEIWIDETMSKPIDIETTIDHEVYEYDKMKNEGWSYEKAHEAALKYETKIAHDKYDDDVEQEKISEAQKKEKQKLTSHKDDEKLKEILLKLTDKQLEKRLDIVQQQIEMIYQQKDRNDPHHLEAYERLKKQEDLIIEERARRLDRENKVTSEPTASEEAAEHAETFEKIDKGYTSNKIADKWNVSKEFASEQLAKGSKIELEHTNDKSMATKIASHHLYKESVNYYIELEKMEDKLKEEENPNNLDKETKELYNKKTPKSTKEEIIWALQQGESNQTNKVKAILENWEGEGLVKEGDSKTGILHEFFTPYWLCKEIADIVENLGISTMKVLEPACGTGRLLRYLQAEKAVCFEVNNFNYKITKKLYPLFDVYNQPFETAFLQPPRYTKMIIGKSWLGTDFDLVISNPPYGEYAGEYAGYMPKVFTRFECLFIYLSMSVVKKGGYGIFVLPQSFMNNGNMYNKQKEAILKNSEFIDAVRLPNKIFASTDIGVDVVILRKK